MGNEVPLVGIDINLVFQLLNTLIMFLLLKKFLFKPTTEFLNKRTQKIKGDIEEAENMKEEVNTLKADYEGKLANIKEEGNEIINQATKAANERKAEIIKEAQKEAERVIARANAEIERNKNKALDDFKKQVVDMTLVTASKFVESELDKSNHEKLLNQFIAEMRDSKWQN